MKPYELSKEAEEACAALAAELAKKQEQEMREDERVAKEQGRDVEELYLGSTTRDQLAKYQKAMQEVIRQVFRSKVLFLASADTQTCEEDGLGAVIVSVPDPALLFFCMSRAEMVFAANRLRKKVDDAFKCFARDLDMPEAVLHMDIDALAKMGGVIDEAWDLRNMKGKANA